MTSAYLSPVVPQIGDILSIIRAKLILCIVCSENDLGESIFKTNDTSHSF